MSNAAISSEITRRARTINVDCTGDGQVKVRPGARDAYPAFTSGELIVAEAAAAAAAAEAAALALAAAEGTLTNAAGTPRAGDGAGDDAGAVEPSGVQRAPSKIVEDAAGSVAAAAVASAEGAGTSAGALADGDADATPTDSSRTAVRGSGVRAAAALVAVTTPDRAAPRSAFWKARQCTAAEVRPSGLPWLSQDQLTEQTILAEVDPASLSPLQRAQRSEKATVLLYGYMSVAERDALRTSKSNASATASFDAPQPQPSASRQPQPSLQQHAYPGCRSTFDEVAGLPRDDSLWNDADDDNSVATTASTDALDRFNAIEDVLEVQRFRRERWSDKLFFCAALRLFLATLKVQYARKTLQQVLTPMVLFRVGLWRRKAQQEALRQQRERAMTQLGIRKPTWQFLKHHSHQFLDWPRKCLEELCGGLALEHVPAGKPLYFAGDTGMKDMFFVGRGTLEAVYYQPGKHASKPKSRRPCNGTVVDVYNVGDFFGQGMFLTGEPRATSVFATVDTDLFRVPVRGFVAAAASVAELTYALMKAWAVRERHTHLLTVYPVDLAAVRSAAGSELIADWPLEVVQTLVYSRMDRTLRKKADVLAAEGDKLLADAFLVVRGAVRLDPPVHGRSVALANEFVGLDDLLVPSEQRTYTATVLTSSDIFVLSRERGLVPLVRENAECGVSSRLRAAASLASRLERHPPVPRAVVVDVPLNYMLTPELFQTMWALAEPFACLQGDELFFDFTAADSIYIVTSGALFERHSSNGGLSAGLPDPTIMLQRQVVVGQGLQQLVSPAPPVKTWFGGGLDELDGCVSLTDAYYIAETTEAARRSGADGGGGFEEALVLGSLEMALQRPTYMSSVRCLSVCSGYRVCRLKLEKILQQQAPLVYAALTHETSIRNVQRHFAARQLHHILHEATPRSAAIRTSR